MPPPKKDGKPSRKKDRSGARKRKTEKRVVRAPRRSNDIEVYCVCRQQWDGNSLMVQCDQCEGWFHPRCVGVSQKDARDNPFICPQCQDKPILKMAHYKMGSYSKKMQISYYESLDPRRLYQLYSIPQMSSAQAGAQAQCDSEWQPLIDPSFSNAVSNEIEFYQQLIAFVTQKKNRLEIEHWSTTVDACHKYLISCLFAKYCDVKYHANKRQAHPQTNIIKAESVKQNINSNVISHISHKYHEPHNTDDTNIVLPDSLTDYSLLDVSSIMCMRCHGQIAANGFMDHIEQCYATQHASYSQYVPPIASQTQTDLNFGDLLFGSMYKSECVPPNPLEHALNEESESDIERVGPLCVADIFDRKKVLKQLIAKQNKTECASTNPPPTSPRSNKIFDKIYAELLPPSKPFEEDEDEEEEDEDEEEDEEDEEEEDEEEDEDDDDDDEDDDIPIAQNIRGRTQLKGNVKQFYKEHRKRTLKRKQQEFNAELQNEYENKYAARFAADQAIIDSIHKCLRSFKSSLNGFSKDLLRRLRQCNVEKLKTRHCGYLFYFDDDEQIIKLKQSRPAKSEPNEEKTMRMELDDDEEADNSNKKTQTSLHGPQTEYIYFCNKKLNRKGLCPLHNNWRKEMYKQLLSDVKHESEEIFLLKCTLKDLSNAFSAFCEQKQQIANHCIESIKHNVIFKHDTTRLDPVLIKIDPKHTDIDLLLQTTDDQYEDTLSSIHRNAISFSNIQ